MKNALLMLRENNEYLSSTEKEAARFILANPEKTARMSIQELSKEAFVSVSTIYRLCQKIGFEGYRDFKNSLIYQNEIQEENDSKLTDEIKKMDTLDAIIDKITYRNIIAVEDTKNLINVAVLEKCVDLVDKAKNILIFGVGASFCTAKDAQMKFLRINKPCSVNEDWDSQYLMAANSKPDDVGIIVSYSGETKEMLRCIDELKKNGTPVIAITRFAVSSVAEKADYKLYTAANEALFRSGAMSSRISQLNIIDILYTAYANRHYDESIQQFSRTQIKKHTGTGS